MVSHRWLLQVREPEIKASHLSCAASAIVHSKGIVKVHGVFPSSCGQPASSPALQVRRASWQDSRTFVTPFVQVGTYPTRNFAQLCYILVPNSIHGFLRSKCSSRPTDVPSMEDSSGRSWFSRLCFWVGHDFSRAARTHPLCGFSHRGNASERGGADISATLCMSPCSSDYILSPCGDPNV